MHLFAKAVAIAIVAGAAAALPFAALLTVGMDTSLLFTAGARLLGFGVAASLVVGLPIALLIFRIIKEDRDFGRFHLLATANGMAIVLAAILASSSGGFGAFFFGIPVICAANVFAIAGWRYVLSDLRKQQFA